MKGKSSFLRFSFEVKNMLLLVLTLKAGYFNLKYYK